MQTTPASNFLTRSVSVLCAAAILAGCASASKDIVGSSVSPLLYQTYSCEQLVAESHRVQSKSVELGASLDQAAQNDKAITGVALVLFWPAAFALGGNKAQEAEFARLKGEHEALQQSMITRNCSLTTTGERAAMQSPPTHQELASKGASSQPSEKPKMAQ